MQCISRDIEIRRDFLSEYLCNKQLEILFKRFFETKPHRRSQQWCNAFLPQALQQSRENCFEVPFRKSTTRAGTYFVFCDTFQDLSTSASNQQLDVSPLSPMLPDERDYRTYHLVSVMSWYYKIDMKPIEGDLIFSKLCYQCIS